jgi:hypothetical protein
VAPASSSALLFVATDLDPQHEDAVNRWYDTRHVPQRQSTPGFLSAQRYQAASGSPKYAATYELESPEVLKSEAYLALSKPPIVTDEDKLMVSRFQNNLRAVMTKICEASADSVTANATAGALLAVGLEPEAGYEEEYNAWYDDEHIPFILRVPGVLRVRRFRALEGAPAYLTLWDLVAPEVRQSAGFAEAAETPWTRRIRQHCNRRITAIYRPLVAVGATAPAG